MSDEIRVIHGDCREVLPTLEAGSVDCIVTDPPYGKRFHDGMDSRGSAPKWKNPGVSPFAGEKIAGDDRPMTEVVPLSADLLRDGGALYLFSQWMVEPEWLAAIAAAGLKVRNRLIWSKPMHGAGDLATTYGPQHESIIFATKGRHELRGSRDGDVYVEPFGSGGTFAGRKGKLHPNQKPVTLLRWLIGKSSGPGDLILDPFAGSGSTLVAAAKSGRRAIGIEIDERYIPIIHRRLADAATPLFGP